MQEPATNKKLSIQQENNSIVQHAVYGIILHENNSAKDETHNTIYSKFNENDLYDIDKMSLDKKQ